MIPIVSQAPEKGAGGQKKTLDSQKNGPSPTSLTFSIPIEALAQFLVQTTKALTGASQCGP